MDSSPGPMSSGSASRARSRTVRSTRKHSRTLAESVVKIRKRHEAAHTQGAELRQRLEHTLHGFGLEAVLLLFRGNVSTLDVHVDPPTGRLQSAVQGLRDAQRVEGVELCGERGDIACLVPLGDAR